MSLLLDYQVIDVSTCDPVPYVYLEMWHCNATGVYSGVIASGNGNSADGTNINKTFPRGIQLTNTDGIAQFESIFPGHYTGRATHIHVLVHTNATLQANNTLGRDNYASHVGQAFFDQSLISAVSAVEPYASNTQTLTTNAEDSIMQQEAATEGVEPVMEYSLLGDKIEDAVFAWMAFGINSTLSDSVSPAAFLYKEGGVANANRNVGGPGMAGAGGSGFLSGTGFPGGGAPNGWFSGAVSPTGSGSASAPIAVTSSASSPAAAVTTFSSSSATASTSSTSSSAPSKGGNGGNSGNNGNHGNSGKGGASQGKSVNGGRGCGSGHA